MAKKTVKIIKNKVFEMSVLCLGDLRKLREYIYIFLHVKPLICDGTKRLPFVSMGYLQMSPVSLVVVIEQNREQHHVHLSLPLFHIVEDRLFRMFHGLTSTAVADAVHWSAAHAKRPDISTLN
jgi:hypothetical protein